MFDEIEDAQNIATVYSSVEEQFNEPVKESKVHSKRKCAIIIVIIVLICSAIVFFAVNGINKANVKKALTKEWRALDKSGTIIKVLDISDDEIKYRLETGYSYLDTTLRTYEWKPAGKNKIKIKVLDDYEIFTIEFDTEKKVLKISPAVTCSDSSETWYDID